MANSFNPKGRDFIAFFNAYKAADKTPLAVRLAAFLTLRSFITSITRFFNLSISGIYFPRRLDFLLLFKNSFWKLFTMAALFTAPGAEPRTPTAELTLPRTGTLTPGTAPGTVVVLPTLGAFTPVTLLGTTPAGAPTPEAATELISTPNKAVRAESLLSGLRNNKFIVAAIFSSRQFGFAPPFFLKFVLLTPFPLFLEFLILRD